MQQDVKLTMLISTIDLITEEFIRVTGRPIRGDSFSNLKHRKEIDAIFAAMVTLNKNRKVASEYDKVVSEFINRC